MQLSLIVKTRSTSRNEANDPYETSVSAAINTPSSYLIPTTDEPVAIGYLPQIIQIHFCYLRLECYVYGQSSNCSTKLNVIVLEIFIENEH